MINFTEPNITDLEKKYVLDALDNNLLSGDKKYTKLCTEWFNKYGYKNSRGKPIDPANIRDIIRNPKYKGYYCANKSETLDFRTKSPETFSDSIR